MFLFFPVKKDKLVVVGSVWPSFFVRNEQTLSHEVFYWLGGIPRVLSEVRTCVIIRIILTISADGVISAHGTSYLLSSERSLYLSLCKAPARSRSWQRVGLVIFYLGSFFKAVPQIPWANQVLLIIQNNLFIPKLYFWSSNSATGIFPLSFLL